MEDAPQINARFTADATTIIILLFAGLVAREFQLRSYFMTGFITLKNARVATSWIIKRPWTAKGLGPPRRF